MAGTVENLMNKLGGYLRGRVDGPAYHLLVGGGGALDWNWGDRSEQFRRNQAMLDNKYYLPTAQGGYREEVLKAILEEDDDVQLHGLYNPVRSIVDAYQNVFRGKWGREVRVDPMVGGPDGREVNQAILGKGLDVAGKIWRMSNFDSRKEALQEIAANLGTVGIRIIARASTDAGKRRVFMQLDHPDRIVGFNEDERGNVSEIELEYSAKAGSIREPEEVKVLEVFTKERLYREVDGKVVFDSENDLGVTPYVLLRHKDTNGEMGGWAYRGSEPIIHSLNLLFSNMADSVYQHVWPTWFATAGGEDPETIETGRNRLVYVRSDPDTPNPSVMPLVARLDFQGAVNVALQLIDHLVSRNPELLFTHIKALSGQSGETIAKLQTAAIAAIDRAKANYEDSIARAMKICMSYGVMYDMWDLGTGTGSREDAQEAFDLGFEDFEFAGRPTMPESVYEELNRAKLESSKQLANAELADKMVGIVSNAEQLRILGYESDEITAIQEERRKDAALDLESEPGTNPDNTGGYNSGFGTP